MNAERMRQVETILFQVIDLPKEQQPTRIAALCAGDEELTREVTSLLAQVDTASGVLDAPALGTNLADLEPEFAAADDAEDLSGKAIGPYRIERKIASGGMGSVYAALRADGEYTQRVAIKLVKRGMDSDEVLRRFRVEKQALAALSHPNIAHLVDGGVTSDGRPYLVMEFVDGVTLDDYCDQRLLGVRERVVLLRQVFEAVRFAHQRLIVHRDLKPRNILVNAEGLPKLLDFGIAKVLSKGETVLFGATTRREEQRLTPDYASPEQLRGERAGTASDVYSLGVILYEILGGRKPYDTQPGMSEAMLLLVREQPPTLPSIAIAKTTQENADAAAKDADHLALSRNTTPDRLSRQLRGDLDTIVLMAMHADPTRRYQSVEALIADVDRYLEGLPIEARKDSGWYRTRKFARRHAFGLSVTALITAMLVGSLVIVVRERNEAVEARDIAQAVSNFMQRTIEGTDKSSQRSRGRADAKIADMLIEGVDNARHDFARRPRTLAAVLGSLGRGFMGLGEYDKAQPLLQESLALREKHAPLTEIAEAKYDLAELLSSKTEDNHAAGLAREAWDAYVRSEAHPREIAKALNLVAVIDRRLGNYDAAQASHETAIAIRRKLVAAAPADQGAILDLADSLNNLASAIRARENNKLDRAGVEDWKPKSGPAWDHINQLLRETLEHRERAMPADHPLVLQTGFNVAFVQLETGKLAEGMRTYDQHLAIQRQIAPGHLDTASLLRNFGRRLERAALDPNAADRAALLSRSVALLKEAVDIYQSKSPPGFFPLLVTRRWLACALVEQSQVATSRADSDTPLALGSEAMSQLHLVESNMDRAAMTQAERIACAKDMIQAYAALGNAERLSAWQQELLELEKSNQGNGPLK